MTGNADELANLVLTKKKQIQTARLILKPYSETDQKRLVELLQNSEIAATFMIPDYQYKEQYFELADRLIMYSQIDDTSHLEYGIYRNDMLIGFVNDCGFDGEEIEIGYVIHPDYKGQGYATEAVKAVMEELRVNGFKKVKAGFFEENKASQRVMEKCGMRLNGTISEEEYRGKLHRCFYCEINLEDIDNANTNS